MEIVEDRIGRGSMPISSLWPVRRASEVSTRILEYIAVDIGRADAVVRKPVADVGQC
jgi:hypothetical protein